MAQTQRDDLRVVSLGKDAYIALHRGSLVVQFRGETPAGVVARMDDAMDQLTPDEKVVFFGVIETSSAAPEAPARAAFTRFFEENSRRLAAIVVVIRGSGFRAAMVRTIASGIFSLMPRLRIAVPKHIVSSTEEGARLAQAA